MCVYLKGRREREEIEERRGGGAAIRYRAAF
jgi:hypothetical protein